MFRVSRILLIYLLSMQVSACFSQDISETEKVATWCKLWGYLKYFHPAVAQGDMDWDKVFLSEYKELESLKTPGEFNTHFIQLINGLGDIKEYPIREVGYDPNCNFNNPLESLMKDSRLLSPELTEMLADILVHRTFKNRYVKRAKHNASVPLFTNEEEYEGMVYPAVEYRLLSLARYWNIIEYYFPYKYLADEPWNTVLSEMIPEITDAKDTVEYYRALVELVAKVHDSHANLAAPGITGNSRYFLPVKVSVIDNKAVVVQITNDSLAKADGLQVGDAIVAVNDTSIQDIIRLKRKYIGASNEAVIRRMISSYIISGPQQNCRITVDRGGVVSSTNVHRCPVAGIKRVVAGSQEKPWKIIDENIGLVNMGKLKRKQVHKAIKELSDTRGIIFDLRNYPNWTIYEICKVLSQEKQPFVKILKPDFTYPGTFVSEKSLTCGKEHKVSYTGKIVILINEQTQSQAEFTAMALRTLPKSVCIGSQTAGADGNVATIVFPGQYKTWMTALGIYYPDGKQTQRIGIVPDITIEPTIEGVRQGRDEVLERGIKFVNTGG